MQPICTQNHDPATRKTVLWDRRQYNNIPLMADDPEWWQQQDAVITAMGDGRGAAWRIEQHADSKAHDDGHDWVLRHYRRGGLAAKLSNDRYLGWNTERSRAWREWHVLAKLQQLGMPAPVPVAAFTQQFGMRYRAALLTEMLIDTQTFANMLQHYSVGLATWKAVGACIARFHQVGLWHPDLNANNILINAHGDVFLIDFDRARFRAVAKTWRQRNLQRLYRSLHKLARQIDAQGGAVNFSATEWDALRTAYMQAFRELDKPDES